ncbi:MAG: SCO family protein, partial [Verrucomicrobiae bacterium]|nr:SCO family protein [Verrucomicrobiae bacterium]
MLALFTRSGFRLLLSVWVAFAALTVLSGCGKRGAGNVAAVPIDHYREVQDFSFTNQQGDTVTRAEMLGKVWVANFVFTSCATGCLMLSQKM